MSKITDEKRRKAAATETDTKDTKGSGKSDTKDNPTRAEEFETLTKICERVKQLEVDQAKTTETVGKHDEKIKNLDERVKALEEKSGTNSTTAAGSGAGTGTVTLQILNGFHSNGFIGTDPVAVEHAGGATPSARKVMVSGNGGVIGTLTTQQLIRLGLVVKEPQQ